MTIMREGKPITLTAEEVRSIVADEHRSEIRYSYEDAVKECEEEGWICFDSFANTEAGATYDNEDDARSDFIEKLTDDYIEQEELYDRDPEHFRNYPDYTEDVLTLAEDFGYRTEA